MSKWAKFHEKLSGGRSDRNIDFEELVSYLERLGWQKTSQGTSHQIFGHPLVRASINVQPQRDGKAKGYQVAQIREALDKYPGDDKYGWLRGDPVLQP